jgi:hypothetical protein
MQLVFCPGPVWPLSGQCTGYAEGKPRISGRLSVALGSWTVWQEYALRRLALAVEKRYDRSQPSSGISAIRDKFARLGYFEASLIGHDALRRRKWIGIFLALREYQSG